MGYRPDYRAPISGCSFILPALAAALTLHAQFTPMPSGPFATAGGPRSVVSADLNGDGKADLVSANMSGNSITVLLASSSGGFTAASGSPVAVGAGPQSIAVADVNGDGKPDLIAANTTASTITILIGDGTGRFTATVGSPLATASPVSFLAVGDFNGDGKADIATVNVGSDSVSILLGNGAGGFVAATGSPFAVGPSPRSLAIGDLNTDGRLDIVVANYLGNSVTVLLGDGSGGFIATSSGPVAVGGSPNSVLLADLNGDGKPDIVTANAADNNLSHTDIETFVAPPVAFDAGVALSQDFPDVTVYVAPAVAEVTRTGIAAMVVWPVAA